jgi:hypothetical protein
MFWPRFQARTSTVKVESITAALTWQVAVIHYYECQMRMYMPVCIYVCMNIYVPDRKVCQRNWEDWKMNGLPVCVCLGSARNDSAFPETGVKHKVFTAMNIPTVVLCFMTPCSLVSNVSNFPEKHRTTFIYPEDWNNIVLRNVCNSLPGSTVSYIRELQYKS